jgi:hypothetical protein
MLFLNYFKHIKSQKIKNRIVEKGNVFKHLDMKFVKIKMYISKQKIKKQMLKLLKMYSAFEQRKLLSNHYVKLTTTNNSISSIH